MRECFSFFVVLNLFCASVYGRLNLSVDYMDADAGKGTDGLWELNSNSSRVGIRGNEKLNEEFTVVYKAEWTVNGDVGGADLSARERYIGLKHFQWGAIRLGYIDSPFKNAEDDIDAFNDLANLDMGNFIYGQNRLANSINYVSPKFLDVFGANVTLQPGEKSGGNVNENHIADGISAAFSYEDDSLYLSFAMDKEVADSATRMDGVGGNVDAMRLNARYKMGDATVSAMYQMAEPTSLVVLPSTPATVVKEETSMVFSGSYKMDALTIKGEILLVNVDKVGSEVDKTLIGGGLDYNFTQNTKAFANIALSSKEKTASDTEDATYLGFGMETRF